MAKKILQIVESAYRGTLEEQDDTVVWLTQAMKGAGGDLDLVLRGNAVNYAVKGQDASGLQFGEWKQTQPPRLSEDIAGLSGKGIGVFVVEEDLRRLGIAKGDLVSGPKTISRSEVPKLFAKYDQIWHW